MARNPPTDSRGRAPRVHELRGAERGSLVRMDDPSYEAVWALASEKPDYVEVLRACHELAVQQSVFTAHDVNNHLSALGIGDGRFNLRPLVARGLIYELEDPPRSRRPISYGMQDIEGIGSALARLDPENK